MRKYSIAEISEMTGLSRRTIRYYLQRGLIPSPHGAGRGRYYTEDHLVRIKKIIDLQSKGMFLDEIVRHLAAGVDEETEVFERPLDPEKMRLPHTVSLNAYEADTPVTAPDLAEPQAVGHKPASREIWVRVPLADGVEMSIREDLTMLMDDHLQQLGDAIGIILAGGRIDDLNIQMKKGDKDEK